jgi:hypothetical protein
LAPQNLFEAHPDYYWEDENGQRSTTHNFCPSTAPMLELVVQNAAALAKQLYRSSHNYYFGLDDTKRGNCHCAKCRGLSPSDQQLLVMNHILAGLRQYDPDAKIAYLAYFHCIQPPQAIKPATGIFLEYAPFEKDTAISVRSNRSERSLTGC